MARSSARTAERAGWPSDRDIRVRIWLRIVWAVLALAVVFALIRWLA